ncbi:hypothetical protein M199_gp249 [Halogranum tailed virus 1]|uniref:Uncharacterized protein n=1 Tax=Halogranum tailed virus 1 TaxID=1273749 RepID=R4TL76_9CAUD|nr:hypothetical protein M199_gp249 [Halogranum tailed virus 1]AGM11417.1 hypothetical protein HGTV1_119 [Halogranum tailed virus 1]
MMNQTQIGQNADFLSIALEELDNGNGEMAKEFADDVRVNLLNANREEQAEALQEGIDALPDADVAQEKFGEVYSELMSEL